MSSIQLSSNSSMLLKLGMQHAYNAIYSNDSRYHVTATLLWTLTSISTSSQPNCQWLIPDWLRRAEITLNSWMDGQINDMSTAVSKQSWGRQMNEVSDMHTDRCCSWNMTELIETNWWFLSLCGIWAGFHSHHYESQSSILFVEEQPLLKF